MSFKLLHEAQAKLKNIIHNRFDAAVRSGDIASVERFFKTFPLIGEHKDGLDKFSKYLCSQVLFLRLPFCQNFIPLIPHCKRPGLSYSGRRLVRASNLKELLVCYQLVCEMV